MSGPRAGRFKQPVSLVRYDRQRDPRTREVALVPTLVCRTRAEVLPLTGQRTEAARQLFEGAVTEVRIRYRPSLAVETGWAVYHRGQAYEIGAILNMGTADCEVRLLCGPGKPAEVPE